MYVLFILKKLIVMFNDVMFEDVVLFGKVLLVVVNYVK